MSKVLREEGIVAQLLNKFPAFLSDPTFHCSQERTVNPSPVPHESVPHPQTDFVKIRFNISRPYTPRSLK
jgi:hypothetical protein